jgi:hypothetical protein
MLLQPADRFGVEVVGRFVEKKDVGFLDKEAAESDSPLSPPDSNRTGASAAGQRRASRAIS